MDYWKCPNCGREFSKKGQFHSCVLFSVADHFKDKPIKLKKIFELLRQEVEKFGKVRIDSVKTTINFGGKSQFSVIFVMRESLKLDFLLDKKIENSRFSKVRGPTNNYYTYTIKLENLKDIDNQLINWLKESYILRNK
ncbi:MAG: DUF5655 domain-containing protein [Promethearchaeota archaeon]|jgi:hypothetical protein